MTQILRGFVSIAEGQVHFRRIQREQGRPLWMVHASPSSSLGLVGLMREFGRTRPVIAPDTLGNGDSVPAAPDSPDIAYYADSSLRVMMRSASSRRISTAVIPALTSWPKWRSRSRRDSVE